MAARDAGKLTLPLSGHGYLFEVLASLADKSERAQEQALEASRRGRGDSATVTVRGQAMSIGEGLAQVFGGKDPELSKLDNDMRRATPMPAELKEKAKEIKADSYLVRKMKAELRTNPAA